MTAVERIVITDDDVVLFRQVSSVNLIVERVASGTLVERVGSGAFVVHPDHHGLLSTRHQSVGARRAFDEFVAAGNDSAGTWAVTVGEVRANSVTPGIECLADGHIPPNPDDHVSIDFNPVPSKAAQKRIAKYLARLATDRNCQYRKPALFVAYASADWAAAASLTETAGDERPPDAL